MDIFGKQLIGFEFTSEGSSQFRSVDPCLEQEFGEFFVEATSQEIDKACALAGRSFGEFRFWSGSRRAEFLRAIAEEIEGLGTSLIERAMKETALPEARLLGERGRTCGQLRMFADLVEEGSWVDARIDTALPDRTPIPKPDIRGMLVPMGPVAVFGASNFPLAFSVAGGDTASALASGNPVVVKAHPAHPGTSELVAQAILAAMRRIGAEPGVFQMVHGGADVGSALVKHPAIQAVGFTGSMRAGRALFDLAAKRPQPIPVFAEMGSINPIFVLESGLKNPEELAQQFVASLALGCGQFCTNPGLVVGIDSEAMSQFVSEVARLVADLPAGTMLTPGIKSNYHASSEERRAQESVKTLASAEHESHQVGGLVFSTTAQEFVAEKGLHEELFGPSTLIVHCSDFEEMTEVAQSLEGQLTATIHADDSDAIAGALMQILVGKAGRVLWNGFPTGVEVCPSMQHGGPYPASTDSRFTSVGTGAILRFARPVSYQNTAECWLPDELKNSNPLGIMRTLNGKLTREAVE